MIHLCLKEFFSLKTSDKRGKVRVGFYDRHTRDLTMIFKYTKGYCTNGDLAVVIFFN